MTMISEFKQLFGDWIAAVTDAVEAVAGRVVQTANGHESPAARPAHDPVGDGQRGADDAGGGLEDTAVGWCITTVEKTDT